MNLENYFTPEKHPKYSVSDIETMNHMLSNEITTPPDDPNYNDEVQRVAGKLLEGFKLNRDDLDDTSVVDIGGEKSGRLC